MGLILNCSGSFMSPASMDLGVSATQYSVYLTLWGVFMALTVTTCSKIIEKYGIKKLLIISATLIAGIFALLSKVNSIFIFYVCGALLGPLLNLVMILPVPMILTNWFSKKQGFAIGVAMSCAGITGILFNLVFSNIIADYGWRMGYLCTALLIFLFIVPVCTVFLKETPQSKSMKPYGWTEAENENNDEVKDLSGVDAQKALHMPEFWMLLIAVGLASYAFSYVNFLASYGASFGLSVVQGGSLLSAAMIGNTVGALVLGTLVDKLGITKVHCGAAALIIIATVFLMFGKTSITVLLVAAVVFGLNSAIYSTMNPLLTKQAFGTKDYGKIYSYITVAMSLMSALACIIIGWLYDTTGSYTCGFISVIVSYAMVIVLTMRIYRKKLY